MTAANPAPGARTVGVFPVAVDAHAVAAFAAALGQDAPAGGAAAVPLTFPMRWFAEPAIRSALMSAALPEGGGAHLLPVHVEQRIALSQPLRMGAGYRLTLAVEGPDARRLLRVTATLHDTDGGEVGLLNSGFLLVSTDADDLSGPGAR